MARQNVSTGGPWEGKIGYSRAVRVGAHVSVSGSTAMTPSGLIGKGDPYAQTIQTLKTIEVALQQVFAPAAIQIDVLLDPGFVQCGEAFGNVAGHLESVRRDGCCLGVTGCAEATIAIRGTLEDRRSTGGTLRLRVAHDA